MPEQVLKLAEHGAELSIQVAISIIAGFVVAAIFRTTIVNRDKDRASTLTTTLILLTVMTAILTLVIGNNMARAFGLVGALSIVRFRTVVEDTRDTAFVIFAVVVGMAVGANQIVLSIIATLAVLFISAVMRWGVPGWSGSGSAKMQLSIRIGMGQETAPLVEVINKFSTGVKMVAAGTAKQGGAMEVTYSLRLSGDPESMIPFFAELHKIDGVQGVEIKENTKGKD